MAITTPGLSSTILSYLRKELLLREGHFEYRSGRHTSVLLDRDRLLANPEIASRMGYAIAKAVFTDKIDTVVTPSIWGVALAQWVAYFLEPRARVVHAADGKDGTLRIAENLHNVITNKRVLLVDNIIVSGETLYRFSNVIEELGGKIVKIGTLWDLADPAIDGYPVVGLLDATYPARLPADCPLCAEGKHVVEQIPY
ncbi:MAG TPA: phosphoribosyltransferase family protein [Thermomicrobiales bacterium]|nr:phosphoribosyltransferase family protein [Thermomicrobiales bacterium]